MEKEIKSKIESVRSLQKLTQKSIDIYEAQNREGNIQYQNGKLDFENLLDYQTAYCKSYYLLEIL